MANASDLLRGRGPRRRRAIYRRPRQPRGVRRDGVDAVGRSLPEGVDCGASEGKSRVQPVAGLRVRRGLGRGTGHGPDAVFSRRDVGRDELGRGLVVVRYSALAMISLLGCSPRNVDILTSNDGAAVCAGDGVRLCETFEDDMLSSVPWYKVEIHAGVFIDDSRAHGGRRSLLVQSEPAAADVVVQGEITETTSVPTPAF